MQLRSLGFLQHEWFVATRTAVSDTADGAIVYHAENSLEMRLSENISVRAFRRMRRVLTEVRDQVTGGWVREK